MNDTIPELATLRAKLSKVSLLGDDAADFSAFATMVETSPPELLELVLARTLFYGKAGGKYMKPVLHAMEKRCPASAELLKKRPDVWNLLSTSDPWPKLKKLYEAVDSIEGVDGARFRMELLGESFEKSGSRWESPLRAALEKVPSREVFAALREWINDANTEAEARRVAGDRSGFAEPFNGSLKLWLDGTLFEGIGQMPTFPILVLVGKHTNAKNVAELADERAPFRVVYYVKSPNLANLLPIRHHIRSLLCVDPKVDLSPLREFDKLTHLDIAEANISAARELLGKTHPNIDIRS